ncbi:MAG: 30S ribosomal protein S8 [Magnetococcales bacterium]|nr:30S ribosomal protein S8 [Magnetococcales bacterium]
MGMTDPISDMLSRIRNAQMVRKDQVDIPVSKLKVRIAEILRDEGYIAKLEVLTTGTFPVLRLDLKYRQGRAVIEEIRRCSRPGRREYVARDEIPRVYQGLGIAILSTSKGVLSNRDARKQGVGGELLCTVF